MCGIVGYIGNKDTTKILVDGLKELEYRGYDSAGIAILANDKIDVYKALGKITNLEEKINKNNSKTNDFSIGIGHTRWATHGKPTELNAHPHLGEYSYVVHNGIIENYKELKDELIKAGHKFVSQTDTEVIVHLFEFYFNRSNDATKAFNDTISRLEGAYSILLITKSQKDKIFFMKHGSPMAIAKTDDGDIYFASSDAPLIGVALDVVYLEDGVSGIASKDSLIFNQEVVWKSLPKSKQYAQKDGFRFFMEKEIYEQKDVIVDTMLGRVLDEAIIFDELDNSILDGINEIKICACGTSYHAGLTATYLIERLSKIRASIEIASEFRYKEPLLTKDTLFVVISQSGETADTLEALKMAKDAGLKTLVICNVDNSSMTRVADATILTRAGIEKGVASTKAFSTQVVVLWMLSLYFGKLKGNLEDNIIQNEIEILREVPRSLEVDDNVHEKCRRLSKRYLHGHGFFFIGRDLFFPLALEGALKLKEISYLHAEGYPAGEMKHGPIALADPELFTIALMPQHLHYDKIKSNVEELSARDSTICAISPLSFDLADDFIQTKPTKHYMLEFFEMLVVLQLFSMEITVRLGNDVDMPRNLAKSVTVE